MQRSRLYLFLGFVVGVLVGVRLDYYQIADADQPIWEPGTPVPLSWSNVEIRLWWPDSYTPRAQEWGCLARVVNLDTYQAYTLEFRVASDPLLPHREMHAIMAFSPADWSLMEGSCYILNKRGTVMESVPIGNLPWRVTVGPGPQTFMPAIVSSAHYRLDID